MPTLTYSISHEEKLVLIEVKSETTPDAVQNMLIAVRAAGALPYRKIVDLRFAPLTLGLAGVRAIKAVNRDGGGAGIGALRGPLAVVVGSELAAEMVEMFDETVRFDRPLRIFREPAAARRWLDEVGAPETIEREAVSA